MKSFTLYLRSFALVFVLSISFLSTAGGIGIIDGSAGIYMKVVKSDVDVTVNNQIATITVTEVFQNTTGEDVHFQYGFPLSENSNPIGLKWNYEDIWYEAIIVAAAQDSIVPGTEDGGGDPGATIDPALEAFLGDSPLFFTTVDTIPPGAYYTIEFTYVELLTYELGLVLYDLTHDLTDIQPEPIDTQSFNFQLYSDRTIISADLVGLATDDTIDEFEAQLSLSLYDAPANFNYNLEYELFSTGMGVIPISTMMPDSLYNCDDYGKGFATIIVEPRPYIDTDVIPKNFTLIIDKSGSMSGAKMEQAKNAATYILENLNEDDYFNIVSFDDYAYSAFPEHVAFNFTNEAIALDFINDVTAGGGTYIAGALSEAIGQYIGVDEEMANIVLFLTDGMGTSSNEEILDLVESESEATGVDIYVNTIGIGYGVNEALLILLAEENGGLTLFIEEEAIEEEIITFFNKINNPVMLNTSISFSPDILYEIHPVNLPNLYQGQQMIFSARYDSAQHVTMYLEGSAFSEPVSYTFEFDLSDSLEENLLVLPKIWAKQKIDDLSIDFFNETDEAAAELIQNEIDSVSICYGVIDVQFGSFDGGVVISGIEESTWNLDATDLSIYPQPFETFINVKFASSINLDGIWAFEILDLAGKRVYSENVNVVGNTAQIYDLDKLKSGSYVLRLTNGSNTYTTKIVKF
jgi:Ca-activated chloride channel family protein